MHLEDHFDDDFLLRLLREPDELQRSGRERHLDTCENCRAQLELYRRVRLFLQGESDFKVPANWVTRVVKTFEAEERAKSSISSTALGWLLFDSRLADATGIRTPSHLATERHLIWESERFRVDMLIQSADPAHVVIIGQLVERRPGGGCEFAGATVEVMAGKEVFGSELHSSGEFIVPLGRLDRTHPAEIHFRFQGVLSLVLLIRS